VTAGFDCPQGTVSALQSDKRIFSRMKGRGIFILLCNARNVLHTLLLLYAYYEPADGCGTMREYSQPRSQFYCY